MEAVDSLQTFSNIITLNIFFSASVRCQIILKLPRLHIALSMYFTETTGDLEIRVIFLDQ